MMNILTVSRHFDLFNTNTGCQVRMQNLAMKLAIKNNVIVLEPSRHAKNRNQVPLTTYYFNEYQIGNTTLATFTDFNINFILKILKVIKNEKIDLIQIAFPSGIIATKLITKLIRKKIPIVYDAHNVEGAAVKQVTAKNPQMFFLKRVTISYYTPFIEKIAVRCADHIIAVSSEDRLLFIKKYKIDKKKITVIPSGVNIINLTTLKDKNRIKKEFRINSSKIVIIFHGTFSTFPNREAINLIISYIAPKIREINKNVVFVIAGLDVPVFERENIKSIGFVEDIYSLINAADIAIVPILSGGGTRLKILDYMGVSLPIVTIKKGIEGINAKNGEHAIIGDDVNEQFIDAIIHLVNNKKERERIGANARKLAEEEYDWDEIGEKLDKLYRRILEEKEHANK